MPDKTEGVVSSTPLLGDFTTDKRVLLLSAMALLIGAACAAVAWALIALIAWISNIAFFQKISLVYLSPANSHLGPLLIVVPVIGGVIIGFMARYGSERIRGHGIPEALESILIGRSKMSVRIAILKPISSAISIGTGGPFGAEGPIIMTGGAFGSLFAQLFHLSPAERKTLLVAGAAGGMSAVFSAPVAAVLLAVELLLFEWKPRSFIPVAVAATIASVLRVPLLGNGPIFPTPLLVGSLSWQLLLVGVGVGIAAGLLSSGLTLAVYFFEDAFARIPLHWMWWPAIGGLAVGLGALVDPRVLGIGYDTIHGLLVGNLVGGDPAGLLVMKSLVWVIALGSGTSGGVLAPLLIIGGSLGAVVGGWMGPEASGILALAAMTAVMGGTMRSPLTAMIFALELTHNVNALPLLLAATIPAHTVTVLLMRRSILTEKVARRGHHVAREYSIDPLVRVRVEDVMDPVTFSIPAEMTTGELAKQIANNEAPYAQHLGLPIVDSGGKLAGIITRNDLLNALKSDPGGSMPVIRAGTTHPLVTFADEPLSDAVERMARYAVGRLPVVERKSPTTIVGYLGRSAILVARQKLLEEETGREPGWLQGSKAGQSRQAPKTSSKV